MSTFEDNETTCQRLDYTLLQNSPVSLYWNPEIWLAHATWLREHGYDVVMTDANKWTTEKAFHDDLATLLRFPEYYGRNLDALDECLGTLSFASNEGLVVAVKHFNSFHNAFPDTAHVFLDALAGNAWRHLLFGKRLLALIQTDDAKATYAPVGAKPVMWNPAEWLNAKRG